MGQKELINQKLMALTDNEWKVAAKRCKEHLKLKRRVFTKFGAHSEKNLGVSPFEHYFHKAITSLFDGIWEWKFEKYSIDEQIIRIVDSMVSEEVRKAKTEKSKRFKLIYEDPNSEIWKFASSGEADEENAEVEFSSQVEKIRKAIVGNVDLESLFSHIQGGFKSKEIAEKMSIPIDKVYKLMESLKLSVKKSVANK